MKIIHIITNIKNCGPYNVLEGILKHIDSDEKYIISLFGKDDPRIIKRLKDNNIKVISLDLKYKTFLMFGKKRLSNIIKTINPNIVHSHNFLPDYLLSKIKYNGKKITTIHNIMEEDYPLSYGKFKSIILIKIHKNILKKFDKIVCCSKTIYNILSKKYKNVCCVQNGVSRIKSDIQILDIKRDNKIIYIYTGVITNRKRVKELIELFNKFSEENELLLIVGTGSMIEECKGIAGDNIIFVGKVDNVQSYYDISDIYISNSISEGLPLSVLEALNSNLKVLLSDIPSHKEIINISNCYKGELFNDNNFKAKKKKVVNNLNKKYNNDLYYQISDKRMSEEYYKLYME